MKTCATCSQFARPNCGHPESALPFDATVTANTPACALYEVGRAAEELPNVLYMPLIPRTVRDLSPQTQARLNLRGERWER